MGDAKRRGTESQRREQALRDGNASAVNSIDSGMAPHYAFIFDRSDKASTVLAEMKRGPEELRARMTSASFQFWEASHFPFVIVWGSWGYSGGLTLPCLDLESLLNEGLPAAFKRTTEKGGLCVFAPCIAEELVEAIQFKIAELQPTNSPGAPIQ